MLFRSTEGVQRVLRDVRESVEDWAKMHAQVLAVVGELTDAPPPLPDAEVRQGRDFITWLADDHFTFLGYREYGLEVDGGEDVLRVRPGSGLGILRRERSRSGSFERLPPAVRAKAREPRPLIVTKANSRATVHRGSYLDYVGVKAFDADGRVTGERRLLGLFTTAAYSEPVLRVPVVADKVRQVLERSGFPPSSHSGKDLLAVLEALDRKSTRLNSSHSGESRMPSSA